MYADDDADVQLPSYESFAHVSYVLHYAVYVVP
jgi:hypothetical protein